MLNWNVRRTYNSIIFGFLRQLVVTLSIVFTVANQAFALPPTPNLGVNVQTEQIQIGLDSDKTTPLVQVGVETVQLDGTKQSVQKMADIVSEKSNQSNTSVVFSTDNQALIDAVEKSPTVNEANVIAVPVPDETKAGHKKTKFGQLAKDFVTSRIDAVKNDKIGFMIVTYTTATETLVWIHSTHLSRFESTSKAVYSIVLAVIFSLNKDTWVHMARPIQKFFRDLLKPATESRTNGKEIASRFLGNLSLTFVVVGLRIPLLSMDQIIEKGLQLHYFSMPLLLSVISTAAMFTWSESGAMIDQEKTPLSKYVYRRVSDIRSFIFGTLATTAALLNPAQYGFTPWITVAGVGMTGALVYFNVENIVDWIEGRKVLKPLKNYLEKEKAPSFMALQCHGLFAG